MHGGLEDTIDEGNRTDVPQLVLVHVHLIVAKVDDGEARVVSDNFLDVFAVLSTLQLIVAHHELDEAIVLLDTMHDLLEVRLQLIVRQVDLGEVCVAGQDLLADHDGGLVAHALVTQRDTIVSLMQLHLSGETLQLLLRLARYAEVHALSLIKQVPRRIRNSAGRDTVVDSLIKSDVLEDRVLRAHELMFR